MTRSRLAAAVGGLANRANRQVAMFLLAYLAAVASLVSYAVMDQGTGRPSRLQFVGLLVSVLLLYYLALQWRD